MGYMIATTIAEKEHMNVESVLVIPWYNEDNKMKIEIIKTLIIIYGDSNGQFIRS